MIGTDSEGKVFGDDCIEVEASVECSDMRGKLYLWISLLLRLNTGFLYYAMSTLRVHSLCIFTKGMKGWAYKNKKKGESGEVKTKGMRGLDMHWAHAQG
jgi:hypothetical protein